MTQAEDARFIHESAPFIRRVIAAYESTFVRCRDCAFACKVTVKNDLGDGYCPESYRTLVGFVNNGKALDQPRRCREFVKQEERSEK